MFRYCKIALAFCFMVFVISCGSKQEVIRYNMDSVQKKVTVSQLLKDFRKVYAQVNAEIMQQLIANEEYIKMAILTRSVEPKILEKEVLEYSNYDEDPSYISSVETIKTRLPYVFGAQKGRDMIQNHLSKEKIEVAEVSRIMFKNSQDEAVNKSNNQKASEILEELKKSSKVEEEFARFAEEYSQESIGMETKGYLGEIIPEQFPNLDTIVFSKKQKGLYPSLITDENGIYIIYIHKQARKVSISSLIDLGLANIFAQKQSKYIHQNIKMLYQENENDDIVINGKEFSGDDLKDDLKIVEIWGKSYSIKDIKDIWSVIAMTPPASDNKVFLKYLLPSSTQMPNRELYNIAIIVKGYNPSLVNTQSYKKALTQELEALKMESIYNILSKEIFKNMKTEVSDQELKEFYNNPENRFVMRYDSNNNPVYLSFEESKMQLTQMILQQRSEIIQKEYRSKLAEKYNIEWNDKGFSEFVNKLATDYEKYSKKNNMQ